MKHDGWKLISSIVALLAAASCSSPVQKAPEIRNVLFISADDHATHAIGAYGNSVIRTPNIDRLAAQGTRFDHAYANSPICTVSRQSIITGKYPHATGVTLLQTALDESQITIADHVRERGFKTAAIGKMHFNSDLKHGFDYRIDGADHDAYLAEHPARKPPARVRFKTLWQPFRTPAREWLNADTLPGTGYPRPANPDNQGLYDEDFTGTFFTRKAIDFLKENHQSRMLIWLSFYEPHSPFNFPIEYAYKYDRSEMPLPETSPEDDRWVPEIFRGLSEEDKRGIIRSYYSSVEYLDSNVGRVLKALDELGLSHSTLVVYTSDHGYLLNHHRRFEKHMMWEESVRVPLIICDPRRPPQMIDALVELVDLVPTILETLDVPPIKGQQGKSLAPLLDGKVARHREFVFTEYMHDNKAMVRSPQWKYIFTTGEKDLTLGYQTGKGPSGLYEGLYNLIEDPKEFHNVAKDPNNAEVMADLRTKMLGVFLETDPRAPHLPSGLSVIEQLSRFVQPPEEGSSRVSTGGGL